MSAFEDAFAGDVIRPGDSKHDAARAVWNGMVDRRPALDVLPTGTADVAAAKVARRTIAGGALLTELDDAAQASGLVCPVGVVPHRRRR